MTAVGHLATFGQLCHTPWLNVYRLRLTALPYPPFFKQFVYTATSRSFGKVLVLVVVADILIPAELA